MVLKVEKLTVSFPASASGQEVEVVKNVSFQLSQGKTLALVGESGSGKTVTALSVMRLLPEAMTGAKSQILLDETDILALEKGALEDFRGKRIAMIFQEPMTSLNPLHPIGKQIAEAITLHQNLPKEAVKRRVEELLDLVSLSEMKLRLKAYPHELSGGQRQRVMIAMAIANQPDVLIADEPTTALDVTTQLQILELLKDLQKKFNMAILFITHDLDIVRRYADRVAVMYRGEIVEKGATKAVFSAPKHEYTQRLLSAIPRGRAVPTPEKARLILETSQLRIGFPKKKKWLQPAEEISVVHDISFKLKEGETLGVVGESGSGKTTLALGLLRLIASRGMIKFGDRFIRILSEEQMRATRKDMQIVFQDPYASLNPRMKVEDIIGEGLKAHHIGKTPEARRALIVEALENVGLSADMLQRYPHAFSGGQRQRIAIARALALHPRLLVFDEPTSALDVSVQGEILDLLKKLQVEQKLSYIFISHDLRVIQSIAHEVLVLKEGKIVERGATEAIFSNPQQPYTKALLSAALLVA